MENIRWYIFGLCGSEGDSFFAVPMTDDEWEVYVKVCKNSVNVIDQDFSPRMCIDPKPFDTKEEAVTEILKRFG